MKFGFKKYDTMLLIFVLILGLLICIRFIEDPLVEGNSKKKKKKTSSSSKKKKKKKKKKAAAAAAAQAEADSEANVSDMSQINTGAFDYMGQIKTTSELNMSNKGTIDAIGDNMNGLIAYGELLITGDSKASKQNGGPLGDKYFYPTGNTCSLDGSMVDQYTYINNVPDTPLLSGLVPGVMSSLNNLVSGDLSSLAALSTSGDPADCKNYEMPIIDADGISYNLVRAMSIDEATKMNPCWFPGGKNPETGIKCPEGFELLNNNKKDRMPDLYYLSLGALGLYILYGLIKRR